MLELITSEPEETKKMGYLLGQLVQPGDIICLNGDLGAGKTHLSQGIAAGLGVTERVTSPTFTLINEYQGRCPLYHMDVYRLSGPGDMDDLGYEEYFYGEGVTLVEWADTIEEILPDQRLDIIIDIQGSSKRLFKFNPLGKRHNILVEELHKSVCARN